MHLAAFTASFLGTELDRRYRLERLIGEGATSWVFAATDLRLERAVAVKLLKPRAEADHGAQRARFLNEGRMLAKLAHPHVVAIHDAGETAEGQAYLVMELSRAGTLEAELQRAGLLQAEQTFPLLIPLLGALACAHDLGIIHRDLKPANIALTRERGVVTAKLLDFGIAKPTDLAVSSGAAVGTPAYMAPEQARAEALGPQADVWAMGVIFFRCLSGRLPFEARSSTSMLLKLVQERAAPIASVCPQVPPRIAIALDRALEPEPERRYSDMRAFARALASACCQDGLQLPAQPEPIGLPDFSAWTAEANLEVTRQKEPGERRSSAPPPSTKPLPARPLLWQLALLGAAAVLGTALWASISHSAPLVGQNARPGVANGPVLRNGASATAPMHPQLVRVASMQPESVDARGSAREQNSEQPSADGPLAPQTAMSDVQDPTAIVPETSSAGLPKSGPLRQQRAPASRVGRLRQVQAGQNVADRVTPGHGLVTNWDW